MTTSPTLRDRRRQETTALITAAALDLAVELGWDAVTADAIAARAGVSRRTFFNYFATKDEALLHGAMSWDEELLETFRTSSGPLLAALEQLVLAQTAGHDHDRDRAVQVFRLVEASPELLPRLLAEIARHEDVLAAAIAQREGVDPLTAAVHAGVVGTVLRIGGQRWLAGDAPDPVTSLRAAWAALRHLA
ncbi:TetR/AcrR family transcriptional regulator [Kineococcus sp. SYSU DK006]|uniref:TetR/AcrR family transcriptional regulator n=1 Tax=Kineococcus sp. SYSU DK006 TaxID=3383127 RepID=UPI003D7D495E